jgi:hypothetical protein
VYADLLRLQENLTVSCQINKGGATATAHVYFTRLNVLHVDALYSERENYMTVLQILKDYVFFAFVFRRGLSYIFTRHTFD